MPRTQQTTAPARLPRLVRMTRNRQISIPKTLADAEGLAEGTLFDVKLERGAFVFRPQTIVDEGRQAYLNAKAGKGLSRAFETADEFIADLHRATGRTPTVAHRRRKK